MKASVAQFALGLVAVTALTSPAQAQVGMDEQVEQGAVGDAIKEGAEAVGGIIKDGACELAGGVPILGRILTSTICKKDEAEDAGADQGEAERQAGPGEITIPEGELRPSLTVNFVKLTGQGNDMEGTAAGPDTIYEVGSGFAMIVQNTAPGYLEIWSIDEGSTYIEGAVLPEAGALVLPKSVQGLYRFKGNPTEDYVSFKFYPCTPQGQQAFEIEENQQAADLTNEAAAAVARLAQRLPTCSFTNAQISAAIADKKPQYELFDAALQKSPVYDEKNSAYVIESNRVRPIITQIELKRR